MVNVENDRSYFNYFLKFPNIENILTIRLFVDNELPQTAQIYLTDSGEWEENWLFQRSRFDRSVKMPVWSFSRPFSVSETSVCMLVPNPNKETDYKPTIGNVDIDLVSELSERISVASIDYSSSDSSDCSTISTKR